MDEKFISYENRDFALAILRSVQNYLENNEDIRADRGIGEALENLICLLEDVKVEVDKDE